MRDVRQLPASMTSVVEAPRAVSSDASPTRPLCAVKRASMSAARAAADGRTVYYNPSIDGYRLSRLVWEERMEQARELYGEGAYERMKRAEERASRPMLPSQYPSREGPERSGPERDYGPSR